MRYAQGGGLTAEEQAARERLRLQAGDRFERGETNVVIAKDLRVSVRSVERWRRSWSEGGAEALRSTGPASLPRLNPRQVAVLEFELEKGAVAHGWPDQRWTLARIKTVIGCRFHITLSVHGVWELLRRNGWSCQQPVRRATERDEEAVARWVKEVWPTVEAPQRRSGPGSSSRTKPGSR